MDTTMNPYVYRVVSVGRVVDGDTLELLVDIGFSILVEKKFRLLGYDSPETFRPKTDEEGEAGERVKTQLRSVVEEHLDELFIETVKMDSFGRYLGRLYYLDGDRYVCINDMVQRYMVDNGLTKEDVLGEASRWDLRKVVD